MTINRVTAVVLISALVVLASSQEPTLDTKCVDQKCPTEFEECTRDGKCMETVGCIVMCLKEWEKDSTPQKFSTQNCTNKCTFTFADDVFTKTLSCIDSNNCLKLPSLPSTCKAPNGIKIQKNISIAEISGLGWRMRGYNPVYDCYPCQKVNITANCYNPSYEAFLIGGNLKLMEETGSLVSNSPQPGFKVKISAGVTLSFTFWVFDSVEDMGNVHYLLYYCGIANQWNYEGAYVLTKADSISESAESAIGESYMMNVGLDYNKFCAITTNNCPN